MFGTKSKFNLDKVKTKAIRLGLAETSSTDAEMEQLVLNALDNQAKSNESDDDEEEEFYKEPTKKKATVTKPTVKKVAKVVDEEADDEDSDDDDDDTQANAAPSWFKSFEKTLSKRFAKVESDVVAIAKKPQAGTSGKRETPPSQTRTKENAPLYLQNPKNSKLLTKWLAEDEGDDN